MSELERILSNYDNDYEECAKEINEYVLKAKISLIEEIYPKFTIDEAMTMGKFSNISKAHELYLELKKATK